MKNELNAIFNFKFICQKFFIRQVTKQKKLNFFHFLPTFSFHMEQQIPKRIAKTLNVNEHFSLKRFHFVFYHKKILDFTEIFQQKFSTILHSQILSRNQQFINKNIGQAQARSRLRSLP